jgi:dCMP deaminase
MPSDNYFMGLAFQVAEASKCLRAKYGSVLISADGRIISTGYNGKPRGSSNDGICYRANQPDNSRELPNCCIHSEINCLLFSDPVERQDGTLYVSGIPCTDCMLIIMQSGIYKLVYYDGPSESGHRGNSNAEFIAKYGFGRKLVIDKIKVKP